MTPKLLTDQKKDSINSHYSETVTLIIVNWILVSAVITLVYKFDNPNLLPSLYGLAIGSLQLLFLVLTTMTKSRLHFGRYSIISMCRALLVVIFVFIAGSLRPTYYSLIIGEAVGLIIILIFTYRWEFMRSCYVLALKPINFGIYRANLTLFVVGLSAVLFAYIERLMGFGRLATGDAAMLGIAAIFFSAALMAQALVNSMFFPYLAKVKLVSGESEVVVLSVYATLVCMTIFFCFYYISLYLFNDLLVEFFGKYNVDHAFFMGLGLICGFKFSDFLSGVYLILGNPRLLILLRLLLVSLISPYFLFYASGIHDFIWATALLNGIYMLVLLMHASAIVCSGQPKQDTFI